MIIKSAEFVTSATRASQYPPAELPEIAFSGRSNVGKSSLINTLVNRKRLVKTSSTPGRTQLINFFTVNNAMSLVDLPGYGYAKVPEAVKRQWKPMIEGYLNHRENLTAVVLILDARRTPGPEETRFIQWLRMRSLPCIPVMTKIDKLSKNKLRRHHTDAATALGLAPDRLELFSAKTRAGRDAVWKRIRSAITPSGND